MNPRRERRRDEYEEVIDEWRKRLNRALLRVENRRRSETKLHLLPKGTPVTFPFGPNARLQLLTLRVWCMRYCVTPEFIVEQLQTIYKNQLNHNTSPDRSSSLNFGLPAHTISGVSARVRIEEAVKKAYPNGENFKMKLQPHPIIFSPGEFNTTQEMVKAYTKAVEKGRKKFDFDLKRSRHSSGRRNYRRSADGL